MSSSKLLLGVVPQLLVVGEVGTHCRDTILVQRQHHVCFCHVGVDRVLVEPVVERRLMIREDIGRHMIAVRLRIDFAFQRCFPRPRRPGLVSILGNVEVVQRCACIEHPGVVITIRQFPDGLLEGLPVLELAGKVNCRVVPFILSLARRRHDVAKHSRRAGA